MASLSAIRTGLTTNLAIIPNLRTSPNIPDAPNPPMAVVALNSISYDLAMARGAQKFEFTITVIVGRQSDRTAQLTLDEYVAATGVRSIKLAVESDKTLSGAAFDVRVTDMTGLNVVSIGEVNYLSADFTATVFAS
jgi:hypothetical protein